MRKLRFLENFTCGENNTNGGTRTGEETTSGGPKGALDPRGGRGGESDGGEHGRGKSK